MPITLDQLPVVFAQGGEYKIGSLFCCLDVIGVPQASSGSRKSGYHQSVPVGEDFVVLERMDAFFPLQ